jgi:hypothetical protein
MERAFEKSRADDPQVVVKAVMAALSGRRTKPRVVVGKGAGAFVMMSRLPIRLRDRIGARTEQGAQARQLSFARQACQRRLVCARRFTTWR